MNCIKLNWYIKEIKNITVKDFEVKVYGKLIILTEDTIIKTREAMIKNCHGCISEVESGKVYINPEYGFERYKGEKLSEIENIKQGEYDHYLYFIQKAVYIQTNQSVPMLGN